MEAARRPSVSPPTANTATTPGQWHASWGGRIQHVSLDPGYYRNISDGAGGYSEQAGWGATASSLPVVGGLITLADLAAGQINHAIAIMVPQAAKSVFTFPAQRTDGVSTAANAIPEGARFRLPASLNLAAINMPPVTRMIAQAAQTYGLIVNDQTGAIGRVPRGGSDAADAPGPAEPVQDVLQDLADRRIRGPQLPAGLVPVGGSGARGATSQQ